ncbi:carboxypeptidase-like regulatory domain-containing protein [Fibrella forsythiae]|uniref:Carboxypeptidase regulatory-like domain-containing protein n=1 Tax=Fibrella forsythiae TaxID=2817061 RepID=A0ABS3JFK7_9BACT|nr:carboxypeptidase-like regulatory domain-containing protein [Fibrella forsythiae]MBO0948789.1 carboxypeptidase regulatory-like domain-containing protein [Fibrella forsythiae]
MKKKLIYLFFLVLLVSTATAQSVISGKVVDHQRKSLAGIIVTLQPLDGPTITAYAITDYDGRFSIRYTSNQDSILIKATGLAWKPVEKRILNNSQNIVISLDSQPILLKDVNVKPPPILKIGDTLAYSVQEFKSQSDRVIADIIRKLPGVEIEVDGRILYQGKPINKYYIEGLDLLESKYRLANDNLPINAVSQVQIIENHQPIRMLDSLVFSDRAALNIKLKSNIVVTGTAHLGAGISPFLWDTNVTPMVFTRNNQFIASWQANNTGINVSRQLKTISPGTVFNPLQNDDEKKDWVTLQPIATPPFYDTRWLINNVHIGTVNYLKKLANELELRINLSYINDYQQQRGNTSTTFYTQSDTINLNEKKYNQFYFNSIEASLTLQKNNSNKYIKNKFSLKGNWDSQQGLILMNQTLVTQNLSDPFYWLKNEFGTIYKIKRSLINVQSNSSLSRVPQSLLVNPGQFTDLINQGESYDLINQSVLANSFVSDNSASLMKNLSNFTISSVIGFNIESLKVNSSLSSLINGETSFLDKRFSNQLNWFKLNTYVKLKTQYSKGAWRLEIDSPLNYYKFSISDTVAGKSQQLNRLVLEPKFNLNFDINSLLAVNSTISYRNRFGEIEDIYYGYLLRTYRTIQRRDVPLQDNKLISSAIGLNYRDPAKATFGSLFYSHSVTTNNLLYSSNVTATGALEYSAIAQANQSFSNLIIGQISKYFPYIKTSIRLKTNWTKLVQEQLVNSQLITISNQSINPECDFFTTINTLVEFQYNYRLSIYSTYFDKATPRNTSQQKHFFKINFHPSKFSTLIIENDFYVNDLTTGPTKNLFTTLLFRQTLSKKKIDFETVWSNIWNTKSIITGTLTSFSYIESSYELRPMQITQKVRFSF